jgi:CPA1 family monovalent cation:H+ antiporter
MHIEIEPIELVFLLLAAAVALTFIARRLRIAEPILLLLGGVVIGLIPGLPPIVLPPDLVFLLFLPPILFAAAYFTPIRDFRANARAILLLAIGLVLFTTVAVGVVVSAMIPTMTIPVAMTLGAIVAPPDAIAATAIFQRLGVPRRIVTILEGESLINDASALTAYRVAIAATGAVATFSLVGATVGFFVVALGGIAMGAIVGALVTRTLRRTAEPVLEIIVSLIAPATAYIAAETFGFSGVLATVVAGFITGRHAARVFSPDARLLGYGAWSVVLWTINAFVFMLIGLQLPTILGDLSEVPDSDLILWGIVVSLTVIVARFVWVFPATYVPRWLSSKIRATDPAPSPRAVVIVSWAGMRGVVSLAAALALAPDFPERDLILWLTFCVILATLVGQGLTLPLLIKALHVTAADDGPRAEEAHARLAAAEAAIGRLEELREDYPGHLPLLEQIREELEHEASHVLPEPGSGPDSGPDEAEQEALDHRAIRNAVLVAQREAVIRLRDDGVINDDTLRLIERDLDLEALRAGA